MRTRRQRKGGTKRKGGFFSSARTAGGRVSQFNQILNAQSEEGFQMFKGMTILMGGEDPNDPKFKHLNPLPSAAFMESVMKNRGSATSQIAAAAKVESNGQDESPRSKEGTEPEPEGQKGSVKPEPEGQQGPVEPEPEGQQGPVEPEPEGQKGSVEPEPEGQQGPVEPEPEGQEPVPVGQEPEPKNASDKGGTRKNYRNRI